MKPIMQKIAPFIAAGIFIVALTFGLVLLAYLFVFGAILGSVLFVINWAKEKFFKKNKQQETPPSQPSGRVIDSDDWRKL